jgi:dTDP-4-amino-4,6-dideoxygalactose transaminase
MTAARIPFMHLKPGEDAAAVDAAIRRVIDRGWFVLGPEVEGFERGFAEASGASWSVGVGTGTDALVLILKALGIGRGDEVITTPLSAAYTALAVMLVGARPVFADLDPERLTLDPKSVETAVGPDTAAIIPVHLYGQPAAMDELSAIAKRRGLAMIEDCCQAHLATYRGRPVGAFSAAAAFSFYPTKNLGALGDGGAITTDDAELAARLKRLRNGGQTDRYRHGEPGMNSRLDELQAAVLSARLSFLPKWTAQRRALATVYRRELAGAGVTVPPEFDAGHVYHLFPVLSRDRDGLKKRLADAGIETLIHYPVPIPRQPALASEIPDDCPIADRVCAEVLSLPMYPSMPEAHAVEVARAVHVAA